MVYQENISTLNIYRLEDFSEPMGNKTSLTNLYRNSPFKKKRKGDRTGQGAIVSLVRLSFALYDIIELSKMTYY